MVPSAGKAGRAGMEWRGEGSVREGMKKVAWSEAGKGEREGELTCVARGREKVDKELG